MSLPRPDANAIWPRSSAACARWNSSSGPASAAASSPQRRVEGASLGRGLRGGQAHTVAIEEAAGNDT
jgi:hypothetical protein